jgi:serine phosphatase RsbU (regulator of sigma subunit)
MAGRREFRSGLSSLRRIHDAATLGRTGLVPNGRARHVALAALAVMALTLAVFSDAAPGEFRGVPAVLMLQAATVVAVAWGPLPGAIAALAGATGFTYLVADGSRGSAWTLLLWPALAAAVGLIARNLGQRQTRLRAQHETSTRMLDLLPRLAAPTLHRTWASIATVARELFHADRAAVWQRQADGSLRLLAVVAGDPRGVPTDDAVPVERNVAIPSSAAGDCFIAATWVSSRPPPSLEQETIAERLASMSALAVEQASRHEAQRDLAAMSTRLQAGLLPAPQIGLPEIEVRTLYRPGERRLLLGGDFYDVVERSDGALLVLIGDVAGHGVDAAALAARMRSSWRALAVAGTPVHLLADQLHRIFRLESSNPEMFATACLAQIDPGQASVDTVLAGHPPPMLMARGTVRMLEQAVHPPLGLSDGSPPAAVRHDLGRHWSLLFLTDGAFEGRLRPRASARLGLQALAERVEAQVALTGHPIDLDLLVDGVEASNGGDLDDDVALVMVTREPQLVGERPAERTLA